MNRFFTLLLAASCLTAVGQTEYPYPYNPDGNNDGYIGVTDLQDFLSVYDSEFVASLNSQEATSVALAYMEIMSYDRCMAKCYSVGGHVATLTELRLFDDSLFFGLGRVVGLGSNYYCGNQYEERIHVEIASYNAIAPAFDGGMPTFRRSLANECNEDDDEFYVTRTGGDGTLTQTAGCFCAGKVIVESDTLNSE